MELCKHEGNTYHGRISQNPKDYRCIASPTKTPTNESALHATSQNGGKKVVVYEEHIPNRANHLGFPSYSHIEENWKN